MRSSPSGTIFRASASSASPTAATASSSMPTPPPPSRKFDLANLTPDNRRDLTLQGPALPYAVRPAAKTLIIGPGGGWDVARALYSGSTDVTAVEINGIIADTIMRERFSALSNGLYLRPDVHIFVEDGRSFVRRSTEKYQVLQATLVDTWAATAAGAFALSENNLYTSDAFRDYLLHLTDDGLLAITRWGFDPPRESLRLISLAIDALGQIGEKEPWRHVIVSRQGSTARLRRARYRADFAQAVHRRRYRPRPRHLRRRRPAAHLLSRQRPAQSVPRSAAQSQPRRLRTQLHLRHHPGHRRSPVLLLHRAAPRPLGLHERRRRDRRPQDQQGRAPALRPDGHQPRGHPADSAGAAARARHPPAHPPRRARLPGLLSLHRHRLHPDRGRTDSEVRALPRTPHLRAHRGDLLHAGVQRDRQFHQPPPARQRRRPPDQSPGPDRPAHRPARHRASLRCFPRWSGCRGLSKCC